jgi:hypothetical protein
MQATIQSISNSTCSHRQIVFDAGTLNVTSADIADARPDTFEEMKDVVIMIVRNQYLSRRAAGRTHNQAMNDLVGYTVRV